MWQWLSDNLGITAAANTIADQAVQTQVNKYGPVLAMAGATFILLVALASRR